MSAYPLIPETERVEILSGRTLPAGVAEAIRATAAAQYGTVPDRDRLRDAWLRGAADGFCSAEALRAETPYADSYNRGWAYGTHIRQLVSA